VGQRFSKFVESSWYTKWHWFSWLMVPFSLLYWLVTAVRRCLYVWRLLPTYRSKVPLIVVGNIMVGGTGKTPCTIALIHYLKQKGYKPGVCSRGYGASVQQFPYLVSDGDPASSVGDEPYLMYARTRVPVCLAPKRIDAVKTLESCGVDVIISDDGLQHYSMDRWCEIVLLDGARLLGNRRLLPAGPLREPPSRLRKASVVAYTSSNIQPNIDLVPSEYHCLKDNSCVSLEHFVGKTVYAVAGIGNPQRFFKTLQLLSVTVIPCEFPDHHPFTQQDFERFSEHPIVMTEKDAVKCQSLSLENAWYLSVDARLPEILLDKVNEVLHG
tara:strand:+ start:2623 stop:3600 length:978 start_codon:yes stop_codon:yes gene_type:complete